MLTSDYLDLSVHIRIVFCRTSVWPKEVKDALLEGPHRGLWHICWKWILRRVSDVNYDMVMVALATRTFCRYVICVATRNMCLSHGMEEEGPGSRKKLVRYMSIQRKCSEVFLSQGLPNTHTIMSLVMSHSSPSKES